MNYELGSGEIELKPHKPPLGVWVGLIHESTLLDKGGV
jgi:hypothetical protein